MFNLYNSIQRELISGRPVTISSQGLRHTLLLKSLPQQRSRFDRVSREVNMAASINTQRKKVRQNCFLCEEKKRHFNVLDYKDGVLINKICCLTGEERPN